MEALFQKSSRIAVSTLKSSCKEQAEGSPPSFGSGVRTNKPSLQKYFRVLNVVGNDAGDKYFQRSE
jgi:hypothetical protein